MCGIISAISSGRNVVPILIQGLKQLEYRGAANVAESENIHVIRTPRYGGFLSPILHTVSLQLLACHAAAMRGNDVDMPLNLAKSVTVE